jgi:hypothetical protein
VTERYEKSRSGQPVSRAGVEQRSPPSNKFRDQQNLRVCALCQSSGIANTRKHNVLETGYVSFLKCGEGVSYTGGSVGKS